MQATCPDCGAQGHVSAFFAEAEGKRLAVAVSGLSADLTRALFSYVGLFKPQHGTVRIGMAVVIIREVAGLVAQGHVAEASGRVRQDVTPAHWAQGIERLLARRRFLTLPLENHDALSEETFRLAGKAVQAPQLQPVASPSTQPSTVGVTITKGETPLERQIAWIAHRRNLDQITPEEAANLVAEARKKFGEP